MSVKTKLLALTAISSTIAFLYFSKKEGEVGNIEGINVNVDSEKLVSSLVDKIDLKGQSKQMLKNVATNLTSHAVDKVLG